MFLPTTSDEMARLKWKDLDVILVTGDAYMDSPFVGVALIGKVLMAAGFRVGIISQPDTASDRDIARLGAPRLFWGVSAGCLDSMVANYTANGRPRRKDVLSAGGRNDRRPDRAIIVYCNLIRRYFKDSAPIVIGGLEASLRRISHYDFKTDRVRRSVLFDARADILVYGMGERAVLEIAEALGRGVFPDRIKGTCIIGPAPVDGYLELPPHAQVAQDKDAFGRMFDLFYAQTDPITARGICQKQDTRYLIQHPPQLPLTPRELDQVYALDFEREAHPVHQSDGPVPGLETFRFAVTTHRGCFGQCDFCSITAHQGRQVISRSVQSLLAEIGDLTKHPRFKGVIADVGGPSANMYQMGCPKMAQNGACTRRRCLVPDICPRLEISHESLIRLLEGIRGVPGIRNVFVGSGVRHDLVMGDKSWGEAYLEALVHHHVSGQLKLAPEHSVPHVLARMGKPGMDVFRAFKRRYEALNRKLGRRQYLSCYFMAAYPGCRLADMRALRRFVQQELGYRPEQVQIFTPTPSTPATRMYYTEKDSRSQEALFVEKRVKAKIAQKAELQRNKKRKKDLT